MNNEETKTRRVAGRRSSSFLCRSVPVQAVGLPGDSGGRSGAETSGTGPRESASRGTPALVLRSETANHFLASSGMPSLRGGGGPFVPSRLCCFPHPCACPSGRAELSLRIPVPRASTRPWIRHPTESRSQFARRRVSVQARCTVGGPRRTKNCGVRWQSGASAPLFLPAAPTLESPKRRGAFASRRSPKASRLVGGPSAQGVAATGWRFKVPTRVRFGSLKFPHASRVGIFAVS
jgi:hypothetical protein